MADMEHREWMENHKAHKHGLKRHKRKAPPKDDDGPRRGSDTATGSGVPLGMP